MREQASEKRRGLMWVGFAYVVAFAMATVVGLWLSRMGYHPMAVAAGADIVATGVIFAFSVGFDNSSFYDPYWSVAPIPIVAYYAMTPEAGDASTARQILVCTLVLAWGARLTWNWMRGWTGLDHEDWRYVDFRKSMGKLYWPVSFAGIHMMPTFWVLGGCLALWPALTSEASLGMLDVLAALVTAGGILCEGVADNQLRRFVRGRPEPGTIFDEGLWAGRGTPTTLGRSLFGGESGCSGWRWAALGGPSSVPRASPRCLCSSACRSSRNARWPADPNTQNTCDAFPSWCLGHPSKADSRCPFDAGRTLVASNRKRE